MTFFQETTFTKTTHISSLTDFWLQIADRLHRYFKTRPVRVGGAPKTKLPNSGMPISNDAATNLSIRAGFTAGPW